MQGERSHVENLKKFMCIDIPEFGRWKKKPDEESSF